MPFEKGRALFHSPRQISVLQVINILDRTETKLQSYRAYPAAPVFQAAEESTPPWSEGFFTAQQARFLYFPI